MSTQNLEKSFGAAQAASARLERRVLKGCLGMLKSVPDPRIDRQRRHRLSDILAIAVLTYVSGGDGFRDMERYGRKHEARLGEFLELRNGIPSHDTFRRVLSMVRPAVMGVCVRLWQRAAAGRLKGVCVALDGKAVRRACAKGSGAPVVETAWVDGADAPLGEARVDSKENEIVAIPKLLSTLSLEGAVVTIDAIGCQKEIARAIRAAKAHYLLPLKDNQPTMHAEVLMFMEDLVASGAKGLTFSRHVDKGHGRVEVRRVWHSSDVAWFADRAEWKDLAGFVMVEAVRTVNGVEGKPERRCFITSLKADARAFRKLVRISEAGPQALGRGEQAALGAGRGVPRGPVPRADGPCARELQHPAQDRAHAAASQRHRRHGRRPDAQGVRVGFLVGEEGLSWGRRGGGGRIGVSE